MTATFRDRIGLVVWWILLSISMAGLFTGIAGTLPHRRSNSIDRAFIMSFSPAVIVSAAALLLVVASTTPATVRATSTAYGWGWLSVIFPAVGIVYALLFNLQGMILYGGMTGTLAWFAGAVGVVVGGTILLRRAAPAKKQPLKNNRNRKLRHR